MSGTDEIERFRRRLSAIIDGPAKSWQDTHKNKPLGKLLEEFTEFAREYFAYFTEGEPATSRSQELRSALGSLQQHWELISRACIQRQIPEFKDHLSEADKQVQIYYARFNGFRISGVVPITYFEKLYAITRSPFTPYPLISIPLYVFNDPDQWQALAHELGHFIYWNSTPLEKYRDAQALLKTAVLKALSVSTESYDDFQKQRTVVEVWVNWLEETFADVCGTLVGGPAYALSGQRLLQELASTTADLVADDEEHPPVYLRPRIALETLSWVSNQSPNVKNTELEGLIKSLTNRWDDYLGGKKTEAQGATHAPSELKMREIEASIPLVVLAILGGHNGSASWIGADAMPRSLGGLINYKAWLNDLSDVQAAVKNDHVLPRSRSLQAPAEPQALPEYSEKDRVTLKKLVAYLSDGRKLPDKELRQILLSLDVEQEFEGCHSENVIKAGRNKGNYRKC